jgi:hypothetical protein
MDNFISTIHGFEGDSPIPAIPISARILSAELAIDSSMGPSARSSRTRADKRNTAVTPPPSENPQKVVSRKLSGIKINDPTPNPAPALTPPKGSWGRFTMC